MNEPWESCYERERRQASNAGSEALRRMKKARELSLWLSATAASYFHAKLARDAAYERIEGLEEENRGLRRKHADSALNAAVLGSALKNTNDILGEIASLAKSSDDFPDSFVVGLRSLLRRNEKVFQEANERAGR